MNESDNNRYGSSDSKDSSEHNNKNYDREGSTPGSHDSSFSNNRHSNNHSGNAAVAPKYSESITACRHVFEDGSYCEPERLVEALRLSNGETREVVGPDEGLALKVSLPFCQSLCIKCNHTRAIGHEPQTVDRYLESLKLELELITDQFADKRVLSQLHFGGGAANFLTEPQLVRLVDILEKHFLIDERTEATLDATAYRATYSQLALLSGLGFKGLNLAVASTNDHTNAYTNDHHSLHMLADVVSNAKELGFESVSATLVYGGGEQKLSDYQHLARELAALAPDRILCVPKSREINRKDQRFVAALSYPGNQNQSLADRVALFATLVDSFCNADYDWVGLDCFAKKSQGLVDAQREGSLRRNEIGVTTKRSGGLIGLGSNARTELKTISVRNHAKVAQWHQSLAQGKLPTSTGKQLTLSERQRRQALSNLMCNLSVVDSDRTLVGDGKKMAPDPLISTLIKDGLVQSRGNRLSVTDPGRLILNQVWSDLY
ncbi:MAG: radical SAM protein [Pseudomonadota bacterium]